MPKLRAVRSFVSRPFWWPSTMQARPLKRTRPPTIDRSSAKARSPLVKSQVRVITEFMGGGFGAKFGAGNFGVLAAHLSKKANAPVRLMLDRKDEHLSAGNRPTLSSDFKIGAKRDGTLTAIHLRMLRHGGHRHGRGHGRPGAEHVHLPERPDRGIGRLSRTPARPQPSARPATRRAASRSSR